MKEFEVVFLSYAGEALRRVFVFARSFSAAKARARAQLALAGYVFAGVVRVEAEAI